MSEHRKGTSSKFGKRGRAGKFVMQFDLFGNFIKNILY
jgi:hypothetical protein